MKLVSIAAIVAATFMSTGAFAADLQIPATPDKAMAMAVPSSWDGFYAGVNAGYGWSHRSGNAILFGGGAPFTFDYTQAGGLLGAQAGFNYTLGSNFVVGLQVDADAANITGSNFNQLPGGGPGNYQWLSTATAKLGYATDNFLVYVDGGYALASYNFNGSFGCNFNQTDSGWTAGAGASYKVTSNVSVDLHYQHVWLGDAQSYCNTTIPFGPTIPTQVNDSNLGIDVVKVSANYHFGQ